jgi:glycosyltransferase involved in cell wall biosynthesis
VSDAILILAPALEAEALARAVHERGREVRVITIEAGVRAAIVAARRALREVRTHRPALIVSVSPPASAHLIARFMRRGRRWTAWAADRSVVRVENRWGRVFDPRARALRAADLLAAPGAVATRLHETAGVAVAASVDDPAALIELALRPASSAASDGLTVLMLGTVNTPHVEHLAIAMRDRGHRVVVAGDIVASYAPSVLPSAGIDVRPLELPAIPWVRRLAKEVDPDVVHAHWLPAYGFLATLNRLRPLVAMAWGSDVYKAEGMQLRKVRHVVRHADVAMADSADLLARLVELGADEKRAYLLNWGVDLAAFSPATNRLEVRRQLGLEPGPVVLSPRALTPLYNPRVIVDAFERVARDLPEAQLVVKHIGTGEPDLGRPLPPGTKVVGHVPYEQLPDWYRAADVCVSIPSSDSSPRSVWEAMACGCACVLSDLPWVHELIEDGRQAMVVPPEPDAVAQAIRRLLLEPSLASRLGAEARALAERYRDQQAEMNRLDNLYRRTAGRGR